MIKRKTQDLENNNEISKKQKLSNIEDEELDEEELDEEELDDDIDNIEYNENYTSSDLNNDTDNFSYEQNDKLYIKNILMDEMKKITETVYNPDIKIINNEITKIKKNINGTNYEIPYDIYVKYIVSSPVNFTINKRVYNISHLYDNYIIQNIYKTIQLKENIDSISNCGIYKIIFNTDKNIATLNKYGENPKMLRFNKTDSLYIINETVLVNSFLPDLYNCKLNTIILNIGLYDDADKIGHRNILVLKKNEFGNSVIYDAYIYEPHGEKFKEVDIFEKFIKELNEKSKIHGDKIEKKVSFHIYYPHPDSCPIGIQQLLGKRDTGLCMIYSYLWCSLFVLTCLNNEFMKNNYDISILVDILENDIINSIKKEKDLRENLYKLFVRFGYHSVEGFKKYISRYYNIDDNLDKIIPDIGKYELL